MDDAQEPYIVGAFRPLQNHGCFLKIEPRIAWVELGFVSVAEIAEEADLPLAVGKKLCVEFVCVETGHRSAVQPQSSCRHNEVCSPGANCCGKRSRQSGPGSRQSRSAYRIVERAWEESRGVACPRR